MDLLRLITKMESTCNTVIMTLAINNTDYNICAYQTCDYNNFVVLELERDILDVSWRYKPSNNRGIIVPPTKKEIIEFKRFIGTCELFHNI